MPAQIPLETNLGTSVDSTLSALIPFAETSSNALALAGIRKEVQAEIKTLRERTAALRIAQSELEIYQSPNLDTDPKFLGEKLTELRATSQLEKLNSEQLVKKETYLRRIELSVRAMSKQWDGVRSYLRKFEHGTDYASMTKNQRAKYDKWLRNQETGKALYQNFIAQNLKSK